MGFFTILILILILTEMMQEEITSCMKEIAVTGDWGYAIERMEADSSFGRHLAHFREPGSRTTALHYAARHNDMEAAKMLIKHGASMTAQASDSGKRPVDVAKESGHNSLASLLYEAQSFGNGNWSPPEDPSLSASSCHWAAGVAASCAEDIRVAYAGGTVTIPAGKKYFADPCGRPLVGWHGTYNPPLGMDGDSVF